MCAALENTKRQKQKFGNPMFWEVARWSDEISVSEVVRGQGWLGQDNLPAGESLAFLGLQGHCPEPGLMADRDGKCCLVTQPLAFWDLWLHPQLRPTLSSRKEAGASPTLSAHPAASYSTCILHVTMLVVVPAHRGPGLLWSCNKKHQAQDLGPSPERWVRTESLGADPENNVQWRPTNSPTIVLSVNFPW